MKAIVLEVRNGTSACLREDGTIVKVHKKHPVGQTIELKEGRLVRFKEAVAGLGESRAAEFIRDNAQKVAMAAAALVCVFLGTGIYSYNNLMAASYMSVDVNPSLEYTLNRMDKVIDVRALNDDAERIVEELKEAGIKHATVAETISETTRILEKENYIAEDKDNVMLVGITGANKRKSVDIDAQVHTIADSEMVDRVSVYTLETSKKDREEARKRGVSAGRYATAKAICDKNNVDMSSISDADFDELSHRSVASLVKEETDEPVDDVDEKEAEKKEAKNKEGQEEKQKDNNAAVSAPSAPQPAAAAVAAAPAASAPQDTESEEEQEEKKSGSSKKKKTTSADAAEKSKSTVSSAAADKKSDKKSASASNSGNEAATAAADSTASANTVVNPSDVGTAKTETASLVTTVTTDDGVALTVVVPDNSLIKAPQDTTVDEYERSYKELVTAVTQPSVTSTEAVTTSTTVETVPAETSAASSEEVKAESTPEVKAETATGTESNETEKKAE